MPTSAARPVANGAAEVLHLPVERLDRLDARGDDVARAVAELVLAERLRIGERRPGVEDAHRLAARVVVDDHPLRADDRRPPQLARRQPRELDLRDRARRVPHVHERDVGRARDRRTRGDSAETVAGDSPSQ